MNLWYKGRLASDSENEVHWLESVSAIFRVLCRHCSRTDKQPEEQAVQFSSRLFIQAYSLSLWFYHDFIMLSTERNFDS